MLVVAALDEREGTAVISFASSPTVSISQQISVLACELQHRVFELGSAPRGRRRPEPSTMQRIVGAALSLGGARVSWSLQRRMFSSGVRDKLLLTLASPSECFFNKTPVFSVSVPGAEGTMTLTNFHQPIISRLKAGQVEVVLQQGEQPKLFFLSDGFLFLKP